MFVRMFRHLRKKPKQVRNNYALGVASGFTGLVALFWLVGNVGQSIESVQKGGAIADNQGNSPFAGLIKQSKDHLANIKSSLKETSTDTEVENISGESGENSLPTTIADPRDIKLSPEDIDIAKKKVEQIDDVYQNTETSNEEVVNSSSTVSENSPQKSDQKTDKTKPYQEIQIITSSDAENQKPANSNE